MIVCKFGGTSLATAESFKRVADILNSTPERRFAVVSAPGKRFECDEKVTDLLYNCFLSKDSERITRFEQIADRFRLLHTELFLSFDLEEYIDEYRRYLLEHENIARFVSMGEHLSALLLSAYIGWDFVDARKLIIFDDKNVCDYQETYRTAKKVLRNYQKAVIPGFYGRNKQYRTVLFERGGSDITGSIIARATMADVYENWTDVSGVYVVDPRIVKNARIVKSLTYQELRALSYSGASVIQPDAVFPTMGRIPIEIKNTFSPQCQGTVISNAPTKSEPLLLGIVGKVGFSKLTANIGRMPKTEFLSELFRNFEGKGIQVENVYIGIDEISVFISQKSLGKNRSEFLCRANIQIDIVENIALVSIIGRGKGNKELYLSKSINVLSKEKIEFEIIGGNSTDITIISCSQNEYEKVINLLYKELNK